MLLPDAPDHPHPCSFRRHRWIDRGWGEIAFEYRWDSTSGAKNAETLENPDLAHCFLYEITTYAENAGVYAGGRFLPPTPPFVGWQFRDPTDGRTGPVGQECFPAANGRAWDRHKLGGTLCLPAGEPRVYAIQAVQQYRFHCNLCGLDALMPGPDCGPHPILRVFEPKRLDEADEEETGRVWRYTVTKHGVSAWMDIDAHGYRADSAGIGFGPW